MKHKSLLILGVSALLLTSCETEIYNQFPELPDGSTTEKTMLTVTGSVNENAVSRAVGTSWEEDDEIGVVGANYSNIKYVTNAGDGQFITDTPYYFTNGKSQTFSAYYPYNEDVTDNVITYDIIYKANEEAQKANDYLWATASASLSNSKLNLSFSHVMTKVIINVKVSPEDGFDADDLFAENGKYKTSVGLINSRGKAYFNVATGEVNMPSYRTMAIMTDPIEDKVNNVRTYTILLAPQDNVQFVQRFDFGLTTAETYTVTLGSGKMAAGTTYTYNLVLKKKGLEIESTSVINDWTSADDVDYNVNPSA